MMVPDHLMPIYDYLNPVQSSSRLEREAGRNLEVIWLFGRLVPDDEVIADFRKDNGPAIKKICERARPQVTLSVGQTIVSQCCSNHSARVGRSYSSLMRAAMLRRQSSPASQARRTISCLPCASERRGQDRRAGRLARRANCRSCRASSVILSAKRTLTAPLPDG
jgi:hypothetical protein